MCVDCDMFHGLKSSEEVLLTHGDSVLQLAPALRSIAQSGSLVAALKHNNLHIYGVQFHPEAELTINGRTMFRNFLYNVRTLTARLCILCVCVGV